MKERIIGSLVVVLFMVLRATQALAAPVISIDTDQTTPGIQDSLEVSVGEDFTVDVVITDDGIAPTPAIFDTVILEVFFNNAGGILGAAPQGPPGGELAGNSADTIDVFGGAPSAEGGGLTVGPSSSTLPIFLPLFHALSSI